MKYIARDEESLPGSARVLACLAIASPPSRTFLQRLFRRDAETNTRDVCATQAHRSRAHLVGERSVARCQFAIEDGLRVPPILQSAETTALVFPPHVHPAISPTPHP